MEELEVIKATIENYIFTSNDSLYKVAKAILDDDSEIMLTGSFPSLEIGIPYEFSGKYVTHPKYGKQFMVLNYHRSEDFTKEGLIAYLSSARFKGIGMVIATDIVNTLGLDCIKKIIDDKDSLLAVSTLNKKKIDIIYNVIKNNYASEQIFIELFSFGLTPKMVYKLYEQFGLETAKKIKENPYFLISAVDGIGFRKADLLALNLGFSKTCENRLTEGVLYTLKAVLKDQGFTYLTLDQLKNSSMMLLNKDSAEVTEGLILKAIDKLIDTKRLILEDNRIYVPYIYNDEVKLACKIRSLALENKSTYKKEKIEEAIKNSMRDLEIEYTDMQIEAIKTSLLNSFSVITGGPGTGKTTIIRGILHSLKYLEKKGFTDDDFQASIMLMAPTGRAAKRMSEACNFKASTIHKALGYNYTKEFTFNSENHLICKNIIIDEASMIDTNLAASLFDAVNNKCRIIIVGDVDQLPSVGPGQFLTDLINSNVCQVTRLNAIMRQASESSIIKLSKGILSENIDYNIFKSDKKDLFFYSADSKSVCDTIINLLSLYIKKGGCIENGIQVLAPMYNGVCGINEINRRIQETFNTNTKFVIHGDNKFIKGDRVLQLQNDPELGIMNGDTGIIKEIYETEENKYLFIDFDNQMVKYPLTNLDNLTLAYAMSIHKSQGSEYDNVILPVVSSYSVMLKKKIIYTAVTRAKRKLILLGNYYSFMQGVKTKDTLRQTTLEARLKEFKEPKIVYINDPDIPFDTLGEYDMDGITPYSFME